MVSPLEVQTAVKSSTTSRREHTRQSLEIPEQSSPLTPPAQPSTDTSQDEDRSTSGGLAGRWLVIPLAYMVVSFAWASNIVDGGDQVAEIMAVLLIPIGLTDPRSNHWHRLSRQGEVDTLQFQVRSLVGSTFATVIRVQVSAIYLFACLGKFTSSTWTDGSAIYYWFRHPNFGVPHWAASPALWITSQPIGTAAISWGTMILEFSLGISMLIPVRRRVTVLLPLGIAFHLGIALFMGITSFSFAMIGALFLLLVPGGWSVGRSKLDERKRARRLEYSDGFFPAAPSTEQQATNV
jgi:antimicrobial peptide system SdpB family protein